MFQSLIGRLQTVQADKNGGKNAGFQSLIGRLQTRSYEVFPPVKMREFQSLIGRLQTRNGEISVSFHRWGFNPS